MESRSFALVVGFFIIGFVIAVVLTVRWLGDDETPQTAYYIQSDISVSGLRENADVMVQGIVVGKVVSFQFDPNKQTRVLIKILVNSDVRLTYATFARTVPMGITGQSAIELIEDPQMPSTTLARNVNHRIVMRPSLLSDLTTYIREFFDQSKVLLAQLDKILSDDNVKAVSGILANSEESSAKLSTLFTSMEKTSGTLYRTLDHVDNIVVQDGTEVAQNLKEASKDIKQLTAEVRALAQNMDKETTRVASDVRQDVLPNINRTMSELERTSDRIDRMIDQFSGNPGSLIRGVESRPGPGESGFEKGGN